MKNLVSRLAGMFLLILSLSSCKEEDPIVLHFEKEVPKCIEEKIKAEKRVEFGMPHAKVREWKANGKTYYYFFASGEGGFNELHDDNCNILCAPNGGITGKGYGDCPDFAGPKEKTLVWEEQELNFKVRKNLKCFPA
jgi:hypothetical protein